MNNPPRGEVATAPTWCDLVDELDRWGAARRVATLWWRDDDAVAPTPQLGRLLRLAGSVPLALAVIPALALPELAAALADAPRVAVLQHGWQHANRAEHGKKSEYPEGRSAAVVGAEIGAGRARLKALFGRRALPLFVPPWNQFDPGFMPLLLANGIAGLSTMARRLAPDLPHGLGAIDVHLDLVDWRGSRGFIGLEAALGGLVGCLRARHCAHGGGTGPIGILTHHRVMDDAAARFVERLIALTSSHDAVRWADAAGLVR